MPPRTPINRTRYTERQRAAVRSAQIDHGIGPKNAARMLNGGQLEDAQGPVPAPTPPMPETTAADLARRERRRQERSKSTTLETQTPIQARASITRRAVALVERELTRLERKRTGTKPSELAAVLRLAQQADNLLAQQPGGKPAPPPRTPSPAPTGEPESADDAPPEPETLEARIAREESARRRSRQPSPTRPQTPAPMHTHKASAQGDASEEGGARQLEPPSLDRAQPTIQQLEPIPGAIAGPAGHAQDANGTHPA